MTILTNRSFYNLQNYAPILAHITPPEPQNSTKPKNYEKKWGGAMYRHQSRLIVEIAEVSLENNNGGGHYCIFGVIIQYKYN